MRRFTSHPSQRPNRTLRPLSHTDRIPTYKSVVQSILEPQSRVRGVNNPVAAEIAASRSPPLLALQFVSEQFVAEFQLGYLSKLWLAGVVVPFGFPVQAGKLGAKPNNGVVVVGVNPTNGPLPGLLDLGLDGRVVRMASERVVKQGVGLLNLLRQRQVQTTLNGGPFRVQKRPVVLL